ncbi:glycosyltransferase family 4 protein [Plesiomonas shigelloides]|uniref:glycosyltransferase family 4 protein n=1 Tax=Plesiomonas shigelloides TaxID=703 RepID=UPI00387F3441
MKLLYITPSLIKCGPNVVLSGLVKGLNNSENEIDVIFLDDKKQGIDFGCNPVKFKSSIFWQILTGKMVIDYDVVHSHGLRADFIALLLKLTMILKFKTKKPKFVTTIHNYVFQDLFFTKGITKSIFFGLAWSVIWLFFDKCVVLSNHAKSYYWFIKRKTVVINNGVSVPAEITPINIKDKYSIPENSIVIGSCANITKIKGLDIIINALSNVDNVYFFLMGDGIEKRNLQKTVRKLELTNKVIFLPSDNEPYSFMAGLDIFAVPSRSEGFGLTIIEAAMLGTPVIVSNIPIFKELFSDIAGYIDLESSHQDFVTLVKNIYHQKDEISRTSKIVAKRKFSSQLMAEKYFDMYCEITSL